MTTLLEPAGPVLALPPVVLPDDVPPPARPRSLAGRGLLGLVLLAGVFVVGIGLVVGAVAANVAMWKLGRVAPLLVVMPFVVVAALGKGLLAALRRPPADPDEVEVGAEDEPALHAEVRAVAAAVGTRAPDRIVVIPDVNAYVHERAPMLGLLPGTRTLGIGTPLFDVLDVSQLRSVLAHELGHFAGGDTRLGPLTYRTHVAIARIAGTLAGSAAVGPILAYWRFVDRVTAGVRRGQEVVADAASVRLAGRQVAADALRAIDVAGRAEAVLLGQYVAPLLRSGCRPADLVGGRRALLADPERLAELVAQSDTDRRPAPAGAAHPPLHERIARVAAVVVDGPPPPVDRRAARALLRDPARWEVAAGDRSLARLAPGVDLTPVDWDALASITDADARARAAVVDGALSTVGLPTGLEGVERALAEGRDRELLAALVSAGWRAPGDERRVILHAALTATLAREAVESGGHRWALSWAGAARLVDGEGVELPLDDWASEALEGGAGAPPDASSPHPAPAAVPAAEVRVPPGSPTARPVPAAPCPPFAAAAAPWTCEARLPAGFFRSAHVRVGPDALALDGHVIRYDEVAHVELRLQNADGSGGAARIRVVDRAGKAATVSPAAVARDQRLDVADAVGYVWALLAATAGPRLRADLVARVRAGEALTFGDLVITLDGVAPRRRRREVTPWNTVGRAVVDHGVIVVGAGGRTHRVGVSVRDAFLVPDLVAELRALLA